MRYIRFLKPPRVVTEKSTPKKQLYCLITITSDLGDSFFPHDVQLSAELLSCGPSEEVTLWRTVHWTGGMRSLSVSLPLLKSQSLSPVRVRIGVVPKSAFDDYTQLCHDDAPGIVSAWSAPCDPLTSSNEAVKLVERRFRLSDEHQVHIWEETGESIARHLW
jgi:hypothetical protein